MPHTLLAALVAFAIPWLHGPASGFVYDAAQYWGGAASLVVGHNPVVPGGLITRGVFTAFVYLIPALLASIVGPGSAVWFVLAWNAALGAGVSVILVPRLAGLLRSDPISRPSALRIWLSVVVGSAILSGFARYPLVDVWAASLALAGFFGLAVCRRWWWLSLAGASVVISANLRPAMIAPILLAVAILLVTRAKQVAIAAPAAALTVLPQLVLNVVVWGLWSLVPHETRALSAVQAAPAPYTLRYDTLLTPGHDPRQWYCDPHYASLLAGDARPTNQLDVIASALHHLPDSIWFLFRKAAVSLSWSSATPYEPPPGTAGLLMAMLVILISVMGIAALLLQATRARLGRRWLTTTLALLAFWFGALGTLLFSTPETRFALPLVMIGLVGLVSVIPDTVRWRAPSLRGFVTAGLGTVLAIGLFVAGQQALGQAMPPGPLPSAAVCATY